MSARGRRCPRERLAARRLNLPPGDPRFGFPRVERNSEERARRARFVPIRSRSVPYVKTAVIVMAYGSPSRPEDVPAYLRDIRGSRPVRPEAVERLQERYRRIGGTSPLNAVTEAQRAALERELGLPVYVGMKHWEPWIADAAARALADGVARIVGLVLAPHYSRMSVGGYRDRLETSLNGRVDLRFIERWHDHPPFIDVVAERLRATDTDAHVVFTAHSLPQRGITNGDGYERQLRETAELVAERADVRGWSLAFQSQSETGEAWLGPDLLEELDRLHGEGVRQVVVAPVGFVSDHLEILWDIDVEARERAAALGLELHRISSLNDDPAFIRALADLVRRELE
jgi:protoporphyrin/coproporphyrin ferrochelatase